MSVRDDDIDYEFDVESGIWTKIKEDPKVVFLTNEEMVSIALANEVVGSTVKDIEICTLRVQQLEYMKKELEAKLRQEKDKGKEYLLTINSKYGIRNDKRWSYNYQTGEVIFSDEK